MAGGSLQLRPGDTAALEQMRIELERQLATLERILRSSRRATPKPSGPLGFDARVTVSSKRRTLSGINGKSGAVMGRAPADDGWMYTIMIDGSSECWSVPHGELTAQADAPDPRTKPRRTSVRVCVDQEGRGHLVK